MSDASTAPDASTEPRIERLQRWIAALLSVLLHVLFLLILLWSATEVVTSPQGATGGSRVRVNFIGEPAQQPTPAPPSPKPSPPPRAAAKKKAQERVDKQKPVLQAEYIQRPSESAPEQSESQVPPADGQAQAAAASPPEPAQRRPETWTGRPPGMLDEETAPQNYGRASGPSYDTGTRNDLEAAEPSVEVGGFQIYYDLLAEQRLRTWKEQGMKEISFPLPGMRSRMVCPVEIALRRGSGKCRLLDPNEPEMQAIGDAREVVVVMAVYRRGELVWRGPGAYR
jgi:hypothetical protein